MHFAWPIQPTLRREHHTHNLWDRRSMLCGRSLCALRVLFGRTKHSEWHLASGKRHHPTWRTKMSSKNEKGWLRTDRRKSIRTMLYSTLNGAWRPGEWMRMLPRRRGSTGLSSVWLVSMIICAKRLCAALICKLYAKHTNSQSRLTPENHSNALWHSTHKRLHIIRVGALVSFSVRWRWPPVRFIRDILYYIILGTSLCVHSRSNKLIYETHANSPTQRTTTSKPHWTAAAVCRCCSWMCAFEWLWPLEFMFTFPEVYWLARASYYAHAHPSFLPMYSSGYLRVFYAMRRSAPKTKWRN